MYKSFVLAVASAAILIGVCDSGRGQQRPLRAIARRVAPPPEAKPLAPDPSSALGQALAACDKLSQTAGSFVLPGLKGDVSLDRCYKGRDYLVCAFNAVISEAKSLVGSYTKIVDVKYPELNSVEKICQVKRDALTNDISGAEDFTKRFTVLKSEYESSTKCAANIRQQFKDVVLTDMAQPPEILKSMNDSIDTDINNVSQVENQVVELAGKMQVAAKAMQTINKIHQAICTQESMETSALKENTQGSAPKEDTVGSAPKEDTVGSAPKEDTVGSAPKENTEGNAPDKAQ